MEKDDIKKKIAEDEDYIRCPKSGNSLTKFVAKNPDGVENKVKSRLLAIPESKVEDIYKEAIEMLRKDMADE